MAIKLPEIKECEECGSNNAVFHRIVYTDIIINSIFNSLFTHWALANWLFFKIHSSEHLITPYFFSTCIRIGWAKKQTKIDSEVSLLAQMLWREAENRGITVWEFRLFGLPRNIFVAEFPNGKRITYEGIPLPQRIKHQVRWIDDKASLKKHFLRHRFPVAKGSAVITKKGAVQVFRDLEAPIIVKPHSGSGSRHTTLHITDEKELLRAFSIAKQISPMVILEEELVGAVYRATVVDGRLGATLRRDQPYVIGDGVHAIQELVNEANRHPARSGPYFSKIKIDDSAMNELRWHGYTPKDILPKGKRVTFHQKVNWSVGGTTADVSDEVHPDNRELFERVAEVLKAPIVGIDFIISDISRSWKDQKRCGIIECNSMPFFDNHHLPFEGKPRNVAGAIWDMVERHTNKNNSMLNFA